MRLDSAIAVCVFVVAISPRTSQSQPFFQGLGDLPGGGVFSAIRGISDDGSTVVGLSDSAASGSFLEAFRWTLATGMVGLGDLPGGDFYSEATSVSADGSVVAGHGRTDVAIFEAFRWTAQSGLVGLGGLPGTGVRSKALDISSDGAVIVGEASSFNGLEAFRWTAVTGMQGLGDLPGRRFNSAAKAVSSDGSVVAGFASPDFWPHAIRWMEATGIVDITNPGTPVDWSSMAHSISDDGMVIVGTAMFSPDPLASRPFRWTQATGMVQIMSSNRVIATDVSGDGSIVVMDDSSASTGPFIWDETNGVRELRAVLESLGLGWALVGWKLSLSGSGSERPVKVSGDGRTIVGTGTNPSGDTEGWIAYLGGECYADCDQTTGVGILDIFDFLCFQNSFVAGETYACDCDTSTGAGVCDVFDFLCFQNAFVGGCP